MTNQRIKQIEIQNFRAFYGKHTLNLEQDGKNLLIYGENGSGKSSLLLAVKLLIDSYVQNLSFAPHRNIFAQTSDDAFIKLTLSRNDGTGDSIHTWSETVQDTAAEVIREAAKTKGVLDYKSLLKVHFLQKEDTGINIFSLLVESLFANSINPVTGRRFGEEWTEMQQAIPRSKKHTRQARELQQRLDDFNDQFRALLAELKTQASMILGHFGYPLQLDFSFYGLVHNPETKQIDRQEIILNVDFLSQPLNSPHQFLNEAKLSAIAISLYLGWLLTIPSSELKILVLDDVLIGLDMSNRLPIINILENHFADYQIFFMTYDKEWYALMKQRIEVSNMRDSWLYLELFYSRIDDELEIPVFAQNQDYLARFGQNRDNIIKIAQDKDYLEKAEEYLQTNDLKAAVIYLRTAFEVLIKRFCEKKNLAVRYKEKPKDLTIPDFWNPILAHRKRDRHGNDIPYLDPDLVRDVEQYLSLVMNPLSHSRIVTVFRQEVVDAIATIRRLKIALNS